MAAKLAGGGGGRFNVEQNSEINVTPFVDVMLVLLIIFMVAAPLASVTVEVALPTAVAKASTNPPKPGYISIQSNGNIYLGDNKLDTAYDLGEALRSNIGKRDPTKVSDVLSHRQVRVNAVSVHRAEACKCLPEQVCPLLE